MNCSGLFINLDDKSQYNKSYYQVYVLFLLKHYKKVCENAVDILLQKVIAQKLSKYAIFMIFMGKVVVKISYC